MEKESRTVIFLDIDGVLQPHGSQKRFDHDLKQLCADLAAKYDNEDYLTMDRYDLGAIYYDWDKEAVERLRRLCIDVPAEIVISSDWRSYSPLSRLRWYFKIHDLDQYITGELEQIEGKFRCGELTDYLEKHPNVQKFVILDDAHIKDFETNYGEQFVYCRRILDDECYQKALKILTTPSK